MSMTKLHLIEILGRSESSEVVFYKLFCCEVLYVLACCGINQSFGVRSLNLS